MWKLTNFPPSQHFILPQRLIKSPILDVTSALTLCSFLNFQLNTVRMVVNLLWHGPGNIVDEKYYRQGPLQTLNDNNAICCTWNVGTTLCGTWSLVTDWGEVAKHSPWAVEFSAPCPNNNNNNTDHSKCQNLLSFAKRRRRFIFTRGLKIWKDIRFSFSFMSYICAPIRHRFLTRYYFPAILYYPAILSAQLS